MRIERVYSAKDDGAAGAAAPRPEGWTDRAVRGFGAGRVGEIAAEADRRVAQLHDAALALGWLDRATARRWAGELRQMLLQRVVAADPALWPRARRSEAGAMRLGVVMDGAGAETAQRLARAACDGAPLELRFAAGGDHDAGLVVDLRRFAGPEGIDAARLAHALRLWTLALAVAAAAPGGRRLDLGLAGIGGAVMRLGLGYATREGRLAAAALAGLAEAARGAALAEIGLAPAAAPVPGLARLAGRELPRGTRAAVDLARGLHGTPRAARRNGHAPRLVIARLSAAQAAVLGLGNDPIAPVAALRIDAEAAGGHRRAVAPELEAGLAAQDHAPDRIAALLRHVAGHGSLLAAPGIDQSALRARGIDADRIARIEEALPEARDLRAVVTPWRLGPGFCAERLGVAADLPGLGMGLLSRLGFDAARIETANRHVFGSGDLRGAAGISARAARAFETAEAIGAGPRLAMAAALAPMLGGPVGAMLTLEAGTTPGSVLAAIRAARRAGLATLALVPAPRPEGGLPPLAARLREIAALLPPGTRPDTAPAAVLEILDAAARGRPEARRHLRERMLADPLPGRREPGETPRPGATGARPPGI